MRIQLTLLFSILTIFYSFGQKDWTVYVFMAEECPVCNYMGKSLKKLSQDYRDEVDFIGVFPQRMSNIKSASQFKQKYGLELLTIEIDHDRTITNQLNGKVTPEVVLVNKEGQIYYQGRYDNSYAAPGRMRHGKVKEDLRVAIKNVLNGQSLPKPWPKPIGCYITMK